MKITKVILSLVSMLLGLVFTALLIIYFICSDAQKHLFFELAMLSGMLAMIVRLFKYELSDSFIMKMRDYF
jgi:hypothetical protein